MHKISAGEKHHEGNKTGWCDGRPSPGLFNLHLILNLMTVLYNLVSYLDKALYPNNPVPRS